MPRVKDTPDVRDQEFAVVDGRRLLLDLYLPDNAPGLRPLIVWIHGGAWLVGDKTECPAIPLAAQGYVVASISYRFSSAALFPAQLHDCKAAIRWLRAHAAEYGIDPGRVGVWGLSAGGHLAALIGTTGDVAEMEGEVGSHHEFSSRVQAVCDWFGPTDFARMNDIPGDQDHNAPDAPEALLIGGPVQEHPDRVARANPITYISRDTPPFLIMHGDRDPIVPITQSSLLYHALRKAGIDVKFHIIEGAGHGFEGEMILDSVRQFFDRQLKLL